MSAQASFKVFGGNAAENYERYFVPVIPAPLAADLIEAAALVPGEHVVDIACGTGLVARLAAERVGTEGRVVGTDLNPAMLDVARSLPAAAGAPIEWQQAPAEALPLSDESFDVALCQLGLMFFPDRLAALREMRRVLSPGGRIVVNMPGGMPRVFEIMQEALARHVSPDVAGFVGVVFSLGDGDDVRRLLEEGGFDDVTVDVTTKTLRLPAPEDFLWQYVSSTPLSALMADLGDDRREALEQDVRARWQEFVDDGALVVEQATLVATGRT